MACRPEPPVLLVPLALLAWPVRPVLVETPRVERPWSVLWRRLGLQLAALLAKRQAAPQLLRARSRNAWKSPVAKAALPLRVCSVHSMEQEAVPLALLYRQRHWSLLMGKVAEDPPQVVQAAR